jgi:hypothetical protein
MTNQEIRYLIANAMQAFTAQPLAKQVQSNPFADRALLAALIIPHLETYMAAHPDVRFLMIEYPAEHLATILALQTLIGTEMMKVVGIINGDGSSLTRRPSAAPSNPDAEPTPDRRPSEGFHSLNPQGAHMSGALHGSCSFSKGHILLASQASGFETAAFVAAIRENLISISDFYIPERPLYKQPAPPSPPRQRPAYPTPVIANFKQQGSTLIITPPSSPTSLRQRSPSSPSAHSHPRGCSGNPSPYSSITPSSITAPTARRSDTASRKEQIHWAPVNYGSSPSGKPNFDMDEEDDDDEDKQDAEERRLMPLYLRKREDKGNGQKALKWLGLV